MARTIDELLAEARTRIARLDPLAAAKAVEAGAVLVDIRPEFQRRVDGEVPGAVLIDRNVLEWRLDPACDHRLPDIAKRDRLIIVLCNEGYSSSLAAATLRDLGLQSADVIGGFRAWVEAELPTRPGLASSTP
ncbi:MAG: rhodanese-like domain-containing protein [Acidimicrobiales bacterium]